VLLGVVLGLSACGAASDGVAVRVAHTAIAKSTVDHWVSVMAAGRAPHAETQRYSALRQRATIYLIASQWLIGEASERRIRISKQELRRRVAARQNASFPGGSGELRAFLKATGQTSDDIELEARTQLALAKLLRLAADGAAPVSPGQIAQFYQQHRRRFTSPEEREVEIVNRKTAAAASGVEGEGAKGKGFASAHPETFRTPNEAAAESRRGPLQKAIFSARRNVLTGPIKDHVDYFVFEVRKIVPARRKTLSEVQSAIAKQLTDERRSAAVASFAAAWTRKWSRRTDCRSQYVVELCRQYGGHKSFELGFGIR
jgi:foldase protein PrsA